MTNLSRLKLAIQLSLECGVLASCAFREFKLRHYLSQTSIRKAKSVLARWSRDYPSDMRGALPAAIETTAKNDLFSAVMIPGRRRATYIVPGLVRWIGAAVNPEESR